MKNLLNHRVIFCAFAFQCTFSFANDSYAQMPPPASMPQYSTVTPIYSIAPAPISPVSTAKPPAPVAPVALGNGGIACTAEAFAIAAANMMAEDVKELPEGAWQDTKARISARTKKDPKVAGQSKLTISYISNEKLVTHTFVLVPGTDAKSGDIKVGNGQKIGTFVYQKEDVGGKKKWVLVVQFDYKLENTAVKRTYRFLQVADPEKKEEKNSICAPTGNETFVSYEYNSIGGIGFFPTAADSDTVADLPPSIDKTPPYESNWGSL